MSGDQIINDWGVSIARSYNTVYEAGDYCY
jgi:hypothetical protein